MSGYGYRVGIFANGIDAFSALELDPQAYDLLITDMAIPGMNGKDLAQKALALRADLPVILCTGHSEIINSEIINGNRAKQLGIAAYLQKPLQLDTLTSLIRKIFRGDRVAGIYGRERLRIAFSVSKKGLLRAKKTISRHEQKYYQQVSLAG